MDCSILMPTYNHEKYIEQAIESALAQETNYSWELLINDDCSTDNTRIIVQKYADKYPDKIKLIYPETNQGLIKSYKRLLDIATGKYLAILESDDYWISKEKLQKQISFLEENTEYGLCAGKTIDLDENNNFLKNDDHSLFWNTTQWYELLLHGEGVRAVSVVFRKDLFDKFCNIDDYVKLNFKTFDLGTWLSIAAHSKCMYLTDDVYAAYRVINTSISNNADYEKSKQFSESCFFIRNYVINIYGYGKLKKEDFLYYYDMKRIGAALKFRNLKDFCMYSRLIPPIYTKNIKQFFRRFFPRFYYYQYILRHK